MVSYQILMKKNSEKCFGLKKSLYLCTAKTEMKCSIGLWCNGNTTDSGPVIPGSNPVAQHNTPIKTH